MSFDISHVLNEWPYQPGEIQVRRFKGKDGCEKIQLRVDVGLLQMNGQGRPDGKRPFGHESLLEHHKARLERHLKANRGDESGFKLTAEDCARLQQEAIQYYHRFICLFQLKDFAGVIRDTDRNLAAFSFSKKYAESDELAWMLQQFIPQLLMMQIRAKGAIALEEKQYGEALDLIRAALEEIREFYRQQSRQDLVENGSEINFLENWLQEIQAKRPLSEKEKLELALNEAVGREDYEKAAEVRDALRNLKQSSSNS
jgi:tetratricopeptide (TPR) repeat protein